MLSPVTVTMTAAVMAAMPGPLIAVKIALGGRGLRRSRRRLHRGSSLFARASLDDFVKLATVQPDTPAFGTIVDLDTLSLTHDKIDPAGRTKKPMALVGGGRDWTVYHLNNLLSVR